jgi:hypothetical protein
MTWGITREETLPSLQNKSLEARKVFSRVANENLLKNGNKSDAEFAGLAAVSSYERSQQKLNKAKQSVEVQIPQHLRAVFELVQKKALEDTFQNVQENLQEQFTARQNTSGNTNVAMMYKNALEANPDRSLVHAEFNKNGQLVLVFNTGEKITTNESSIKEYVQQTIGIAAATPFFDWIQFNVDANVPQEDRLPGMLTWNKEDGTLDLRMGNDATLQLGMEMYCPPVLNNSGSLITSGMVVRATGGDMTSGRITMQPALADATLNAFSVLGIATEDVPNGSTGFITVFGLVRELNTTGVPFGETWLSGDTIYISSTVPGRLTNHKPTPPALTVPVAFVGVKDAVVGNLFVRTAYIPRPDYGNFYDSTTQLQTAVNTPKAVQFNTTNESFGITKNAGGTTFTCTKAGLYNFQFTLQVDKLNSSENNIWIWYRVNGVDVAGSTSKLSIKGSNTYLVPSSNFTKAMDENDYFQLMWAVDSTDVRLSPPAPTGFCPTSISASLNISQVDIS